MGEFHNASQNEAGDNFVEMSMSLGILNTMWRTRGPTYCGLAGHRSHRPHFGATVWFGMREESCNMLEVGSQASADSGCPPSGSSASVGCVCSEDEEGGTGSAANTMGF